MRNRPKLEKVNCWEFMRCGREAGGGSAGGEGPCPVLTQRKLNGIHGGKNAGRSCWVVAGTMCRGEVQGSFAKKYKNCGKCNFFIKVRLEEGYAYKSPAVLLNMFD